MQTVKSHLATRWRSNAEVSLIQQGVRAESSLWREGAFSTTEEGQIPLIPQLEKEKRFLLLFYLYVVTNCSTTWFASLINQTPAFLSLAGGFPWLFPS